MLADLLTNYFAFTNVNLFLCKKEINIIKIISKIIKKIFAFYNFFSKKKKKDSLPAIIGPPINLGSKGRSDVVDGDKFNEGVLLAASSAYRGNNKIINWIYTRSISIAT